MKNILAINFGGIGDEILFLPALISLKKEFPNAKITLALEPRSKGIKDLTDVIDDLMFVDIKKQNKYSELFKFIIDARKRHFDLVVGSGGNKFISIIIFLTGIKKRYGYNTGAISRFALTRAVSLDKNQYAVNMYHNLVTPITKNKTYLPEFNIETVEKIPNSVLIHPGVSKLSVENGMIKTIGASTWAKVVDLLIENGKKVILAGGPDDKVCIETMRKIIRHKDSENFVDYYGKTKNLVDLAKLISSAEKFLCSDSAPLHIGVALKTKTFAIFGPTDYNKLIPKSPDVVAITTNDNCPQKPCLWERRQTTCKKRICLNITPENIVSIVSNY